MAWSHFTAALADGELITAAQRNELFAAFLERAAAASMSGTYTSSAEVEASTLQCDLVLESGSPVRLMEAINALSVRYVRTDRSSGATMPATSSDYYYVPAASDTTNVLVEAGAVFGLSSSAVAELRANPLLNHRLRWNLIRKAIQLLSNVRIFTSGDGRAWQKNGTPDPSWATARANFIGAGETAAGSPGTANTTLSGDYLAGDYSANGMRKEHDLIIPAIASFSGGYTLHAWRETGSELAGPDLVYSFDGSTDTVNAADTGANKTREAIASATRTSTGTLALGVNYLAWTDSGELDAFEPNPSGDTSIFAVSALSGFYATPTFTHP